MNIPASLLPPEEPEINYAKSNYTWLVFVGAGLTVVPYIMFVINFIQRTMNPNLFLEHLGNETQKSLNGVEDMLTYVLMIFMGLSVVGILTGLIGAVILLLKYNSEAGFKAIRAGCGTSLCCQGILIICGFTVWIAKALALFNGDVIIDDVRIIYTPDRLYSMSTVVFLNSGMIWGVWIIILPVFMMIYFAERDLKRREPTHI
ncbi:MAG: hypothetical protein HOB73_09665 [Planctomycetaceae bacterium]|jgi:hypothetical protein|nr:hypothetical protein [Planctomycetaceae bacterium]